MSEIRVTMTGVLKKRISGAVTVASGQTIAQALESLQLGTTEPVIALVNGHNTSWDYILQEGDEIVLIQTLAGGAQILNR